MSPCRPSVFFCSAQNIYIFQRKVTQTCPSWGLGMSRRSFNKNKEATRRHDKRGKDKTRRERKSRFGWVSFSDVCKEHWSKQWVLWGWVKIVRGNPTITTSNSSSEMTWSVYLSLYKNDREWEKEGGERRGKYQNPWREISCYTHVWIRDTFGKGAKSDEAFCHFFLGIRPLIYYVSHVRHFAVVLLTKCRTWYVGLLDNTVGQLYVKLGWDVYCPMSSLINFKIDSFHCRSLSTIMIPILCHYIRLYLYIYHSVLFFEAELHVILYSDETWLFMCLITLIA